MMISPLIKKIETNEFIIPHRTGIVKVSPKKYSDCMGGGKGGRGKRSLFEKSSAKTFIRGSRFFAVDMGL